ncbi:MAG: hypothetical protein K9H61_03795 [Bacteroidia bacterium]|nr:hypothetical protein [Bacteroidia bacterium]MCF8425326.1 hypothetical protein [Bacteroidia bacterium]MCF8446097.1 hypothetical protein [Bacteroidia bacterium]
MLLTIFIILLAINIIGFMNRRRAWSKIFLVSQVFVVGGLVVMFNVSNSQSGIQGIQAKKDANKEVPAKLDQLKDMATDKNQHSDTVDSEKETQKGNQVKF